MFTETSMGIFLEVNLAFFSALNYNSGTVNFFCDLMSEQGCVKTEKLSSFSQTLHNFNSLQIILSSAINVQINLIYYLIE